VIWPVLIVVGGVVPELLKTPADLEIPVKLKMRTDALDDCAVGRARRT